MKIAFKMKLFPGQAGEYQRRHDEIWPELQQLLKESTVSDYRIFLDEETNTLFAFQEVAEKIDLTDNPVMKKWWKYMADIMDTNPDNSPVVSPLKEVFSLK